MIHIVTGPVGSGKTAFLKRAVAALQAGNVHLTGYVSERVLESGGETLGYDIAPLDGSRPLPFLRKKGEEYWPRTGVYFFNPDGLQAAWTIIRGTLETEILVVDEVGPVELDGGGVWPPLKNVLFIPSFRGLFVVRDSIVADFQAILESRPTRVFDIRDRRAYQELIDAIIKPS